MEHTRNCPKCASIIYYVSKKGVSAAAKRGSNCRKCTDAANIGMKMSSLTRQRQGENNARYWKGKKRAPETIEKIRLKRLGRPSWNSGKIGVYSPESLNKMRIARLADLEKKASSQLRPNFNKAACFVIDEFGKANGYSFQHAKNGGEFYISELGYWVDGYDKTKNVVIEYNEIRHHNRTRIRQKDSRRQEEIINFLGCEFIILEETEFDRWDDVS